MPADPPAWTVLHRLALVLSTAVVLALVGCAAPSPANGEAAPAATTSDTALTTRAPSGAPVPAPAQNPEDDATGGTVQIDRSCSTDAECTVKNVGNCCGYYPACVNVDSPTDPEGVKAQCGKSGMASVCGFPAITSCQCVAGRCEGGSQALLE